MLSEELHSNAIENQFSASIEQYRTPFMKNESWEYHFCFGFLSTTTHLPLTQRHRGIAVVSDTCPCGIRNEMEFDLLTSLFRDPWWTKKTTANERVENTNLARMRDCLSDELSKRCNFIWKQISSLVVLLERNLNIQNFIRNVQEPLSSSGTN